MVGFESSNVFVRESKEVAVLCAVVFEPRALNESLPVTFNVSVVTQDGFASEIHHMHLLSSIYVATI